MSKNKKLALMQAKAVQSLLAHAREQEEARQGRKFTPNEAIAFKCGLYAGLNADLMQYLEDPAAIAKSA